MDDRRNAHIVKVFHRLAAMALAGFGVGFAGLFIAILLIRVNDTFAEVAGLSAVMLMVVTAVIYCGIVAREAIASGYQSWQFSVRTMLIVTTLIAAMLGFAVYAFR